MALTLIIIGGVIVVASFGFAIYNMINAASDMGSLFDSGPGKMFKLHGLAMLGMLIGGVMLSVGLLMGGYQILQKIFGF